MSHTQRNHQPAGGPAATLHATYTHKSTIASAIPATATTSSSSSASDDSTATAAAAPVKRGRGRPRKTPLETNNDNDSNPKTSDNAPEPERRKRGRPPKLEKVVKPPVDPTVPKRGRGRPRKVIADTDESTGVSGSTTPCSMATSASAQRPSARSTATPVGHHDSVSEPPRKRGRPRKV
ncbi:hypothetical protein BGW39_001876 [Mortierella sp. 14UC]|nr:hypothetical protein BGW39_001876 [Mortierella sp. 14UC]